MSTSEPTSSPQKTSPGPTTNSGHSQTNSSQQNQLRQKSNQPSLTSPEKSNKDQQNPQQKRRNKKGKFPRKNPNRRGMRGYRNAGRTQYRRTTEPSSDNTTTSDHQTTPPFALNTFYNQPAPAVVAAPYDMRYFDSAYPSIDWFGLVRDQLEYYFSVENLIHDVWLRTQMDDNGYIAASMFSNFNRLKQYGIPENFVLECARSSPKLYVRDGGIRRRGDWYLWTFPPRPEMKDVVDSEEETFSETSASTESIDHALSESSESSNDARYFFAPQYYPPLSPDFSQTSESITSESTQTSERSALSTSSMSTSSSGPETTSNQPNGLNQTPPTSTDASTNTPLYTSAGYKHSTSAGSSGSAVFSQPNVDLVTKQMSGLAT